MIYVSVPSLKNIAIINVATGLCKQPDIRDAIRQHSIQFDPAGGFICVRGFDYLNSLRQLENSILNKVSLLSLPNLLKAKVSNVVTPVLLQILEWIRYGRKDIEYINNIQWTNEGTIDKVKTLKQLVHKDSKLYINNHFELACRYCSEDDIPNLWHKLDKKTQKKCLQMCTEGEGQYNKYYLIEYWTNVIKNDSSKLLDTINPCDISDLSDCNSSVYKDMFLSAIDEGNILAVKYFWNKLAAEEISYNLAKWIKYTIMFVSSYNSECQYINKYSDIFFFLLSQMHDADQQREVIQKDGAVVLNSLFLYWPWQRLLLPTIKKIWSSLDEKVFMQFLSRVGKEIKVGKNTESLLRELFQESPVNLKKCFIQCIINNHFCSTDIICNLLAVEDVGTVTVILNYASVEEKKQIIFSIVRSDKLCNVINTNKLSLFDVLIDETLLSETDIHKLKVEIIQKHGNRLCHDWICDDNFQMVEKFIDWAFNSKGQIDNFKNKRLNKVQITYAIIQGSGNYELADKFMSWCFRNKQEIDQFKKDFLESKFEIITIEKRNWDAFEKIIRWCFISDEDINMFKFNLLHSTKMSWIIYQVFTYQYDFVFIDNLIRWCCHSDEEIREFKKEFLLSRTWMDILQQVVNIEVNSAKCNNWKLLRKIIKFFFPVEKEIIIKLKERITANINFNDYRKDFKKGFFPIEKRDLFFLIDNNYDIYDDKNSSDSDDTDIDDNIRHLDNYRLVDRVYNLDTYSSS